MQTEQATPPALSLSPRQLSAIILPSSLLILPGILDLVLVPRFIALFTGLMLLAFHVARRKAEIKLELNAVNTVYLLFGCFVLFSGFYAINKAEAIFECGRNFGGIAIFFVAVAVWRKYGAQFTLTLAKLSLIITTVALAPVCFQTLRLNDFSHNSVYELTGLNAHKNLISSFLFIQLFFLIIGYKHFNVTWKRAAVVVIILTVLLLLFLRTKAVWLGATFALLTFLTLQLPALHKVLPSQKFRRITLVVVLLLLNLFFLKLLPLGVDRLLSNKPTAKQEQPGFLDTERLMVWKKTYHLIDKAPLLGIGAGNWQVNFPDAGLDGLWRVEDLNVTFQRPHNDFLWILSENGLVGFNLYLLFLLFINYAVMRALSSSTSAFLKKELLLGAAFLAGYLVISFFDFPKERMEHIVWFNLLLAFLFAGSQAVVPTQNSKTYALKPVHFAGTGVLAAFFLLFGFLRFKGEYFTRLVYDSRKVNQNAVIKFGSSALSFAYSLDPTSVPLYWYTGNARALAKDYTGALRDFEEAHKQHPYNRNVLNDLASACSLNGNKTKAIALYKEAARISPRFDDPKLNLAVIYLSENNPEEALSWLNQLMHNSDSRTRYTQLANSLLSGKNP